MKTVQVFEGDGIDPSTVTQQPIGYLIKDLRDPNRVWRGLEKNGGPIWAHTADGVLPFPTYQEAARCLSEMAALVAKDCMIVQQPFWDFLT